jgi:hypothetical protein
MELLSMTGLPAQRAVPPNHYGPGRNQEAAGATRVLPDARRLFCVPPALSLPLLLAGLSLHLLLLAQHRPLLRELDVVDGYVDLRNPQADQVLYPVYHVAAHRL